MHSPCIILTPPWQIFKLIGAQKPWTINDASDITIFDNSVSIDGA